MLRPARACRSNTFRWENLSTVPRAPKLAEHPLSFPAALQRREPPFGAELFTAIRLTYRRRLVALSGAALVDLRETSLGAA